MPWVLAVTSFARAALRAARSLALATLIAGATVLVGLWERDEPARALVLMVLCLAPGAVLLHATTLLAAIPARIRPEAVVSRGLLIGPAVTLLLRPWYWALVALALATALVLLPLAVLVLLGLR